MSSLGDLSDQDLLVLMTAREPDALGAIYDRHISPVWAFALLSRGSVPAAERAVYEAFARLWREAEADNDTRPLAVRLLKLVRSSDGELATP
jgi:DNA-directed RNA polymerase specialized sigma24 family protein